MRNNIYNVRTSSVAAHREGKGQRASNALEGNRPHISVDRIVDVGPTFVAVVHKNAHMIPRQDDTIVACPACSIIVGFPTTEVDAVGHNHVRSIKAPPVVD